ncbi:MAG: hypothetical protein ACI8RD_005097, partial [Bacillariaceae sp.]
IQSISLLFKNNNNDKVERKSQIKRSLPVRKGKKNNWNIRFFFAKIQIQLH